MNRYEFLGHLHGILKPKTYLEIGVQYGWSFALSSFAETAIGIDPQPLVAPTGNQVIFAMTSDRYFATHAGAVQDPIDLAFIDGMHLHEYAFRDFQNVEEYSHAGTVIALDDMLPRNNQEAARIQCPGDWTGDVWKVHPALVATRPDLILILVDTFPTGILLIMNPDPGHSWGDTPIPFPHGDAVPISVINRTDAIQPDLALQFVRQRQEKAQL